MQVERKWIEKDICLSKWLISQLLYIKFNIKKLFLTLMLSKFDQVKEEYFLNFTLSKKNINLFLELVGGKVKFG